MLLAALKAARPKQWTKNGILFAALLFSEEYRNPESVLLALGGFAAFSALSSSGYIFNDLLDVEADRLHPKKCKRPIASGALPVTAARATMALLLVGGLGLAWAIDPVFMIVAASYLTVTLSYTLKLKHVVILDVMFIAGGFILRAVGGAAAIGVGISPWFLLTTAFAALFLGVHKRLGELRMLDEKAAAFRSNLGRYTPPMLQEMNAVVTAGVLISYAMWTFSGTDNSWLMLTLPFVVYGIFRYIYLVHAEGAGDAPDTTLLRDRPLQANIGMYLVVFLLVMEFQPHLDRLFVP